MSEIKTRMPLKYLVRGTAHTLEELEQFNQPKIRARAESSSYHKGFRVAGHPPGSLEQARQLSETALSKWLQIPSSTKKPPAWDESLWAASKKKKSVRTKPYEIFSSAEVCVDLAKKAGWSYVCIVGICK